MRSKFRRTKLILLTILLIVTFYYLFLFIFHQNKFVIKELDKDCNCYKEVINYNSNYYNNIEVLYGNELLGYDDVSYIKTKDKVDTSKLGEYKVQYEVKYKNNKSVIDAIVEVTDLDKPIIELNDTSDIRVCPNTKKFNINYQATDNYDGDITDKVNTKLVDDKLILEVSDSHNNKEEKELNVIFEDNEAPTLTLNGKSKVTLLLGSTYKEAGATANDNCDGNLNDKIKIEGNVDTSKEGTYKIKYTVSDSNKNEVTKERVVKVIKQNIITNTNNSDKIIYLTFDDGPGPYTEKLLDILNKYNVKVTFFVTNQYPKYQYLIKREYEEGHAIALHSYSHKYSQIYSSVDAYFDDLNKMQNIIKEQTGTETRLVRFPGGSSNTVSKNYSQGIMSELANELSNRGYVYFDWNVTSGDAGGTTNTNTVINNVVKTMNGKTLVVLQHDIKNFSVNAVEEIIKEGLNRGYSFKKLDTSSYTPHHKIAN